MKLLLAPHIVAELTAFAERIASPAQREWARAMFAEIHHIENHKDALFFSIGCLEAIVTENLRMRKSESLLRFGLLGAAAFWSCAKIYLLLQMVGAETTFPIFLWTTLLASALSYAGGAISAFCRRPLYFCAFLFAALVSVTMQFSFTVWGTIFSDAMESAGLAWRLGLIAEEYFVWTVFLMGAFLTAFQMRPSYCVTTGAV